MRVVPFTVSRTETVCAGSPSAPDRLWLAGYLGHSRRGLARSPCVCLLREDREGTRHKVAGIRHARARYEWPGLVNGSSAVERLGGSVSNARRHRSASRWSLVLRRPVQLTSLGQTTISVDNEASMHFSTRPSPSKSCRSSEPRQTDFTFAEGRQLKTCHHALPLTLTRPARALKLIGSAQFSRIDQGRR